MKTVVVTGATSGIGLGVVKALVGRGDVVIAIGRNELSCKKAYEQISKTKLKNLAYLPCDLSKQNEIRETALKIKSVLEEDGIDVLINNAAAVPNKRILTENKIELQFAVNHLAPFLLTHLLFPLLKKNKGIIINTSSRSHYTAHLDFDNLMMDKKYFILTMYGRTKLCNTIFTYEFNRRYISDNLIAYALDPGMVKTNIGKKRTNRFISWVWKTYTKKGQEPEEVAHHYLDLIDNPKHFAEPYYYKYGKFIEPSDYAKRSDVATKLWNASMKMTGIKDFG